MAEYVFEARLTVSAGSDEEADRLAEDACRFLNEPVLFACLYLPGGEIAPPHLQLLHRDETASEGGTP
jgi:hypothetical protein